MAQNTEWINSYKIYVCTIFLIACITFVTYLPALQNGFVWDDDLYVLENQNIQTIDLRFLKWSFTSTVASLWHPLTIISFALDYNVWRLNPWGYHLTNIVVHTLNTILVFILTVQLIKIAILWNYNLNKSWQTNKNSEKVLTGGAVTALLFGLHPLHVESVAWIAERKDVLSAFFFLSSLLAYLKYASYTGSRRYRFYWACLGSFIMALMSKPIAVSVPVVLLILDLYPLKRLTLQGGLEGMKVVLTEKIPFIILSFLAALATIWAHYIGGGFSSFNVIPFWARIFVATQSLIFYLYKMFLPFNLAPYYPHPGIINPFTIEYVKAFVLFSVIIFFSIRSLKWNRLFFSVCLYYLFTLIPVLGFVQVGSQAAADRYTYLPSLGPFLLAGVGIGTVVDRCSKLQCRLVVIGALILILGIMVNKTYRQISIWRDSITLWTHDIKMFPNTASVAYNNRGAAQSRIGNYRQAITDFEAAIKINPSYSEASYNIGTLYRESGYNRKAIDFLNMAINYNPRYAKAYNNRGNAYRSMGNYQAAILDYDRAIEINSKDAIAYNNRGASHQAIGNYQQSVKNYFMATELNPDYAEAYYNLGSVYIQLKKVEQARISYQKAADLGLKQAQEFLKTSFPSSQ